MKLSVNYYLATGKCFSHITSHIYKRGLCVMIVYNSYVCGHVGKNTGYLTCNMNFSYKPCTFY